MECGSGARCSGAESSSGQSDHDGPHRAQLNSTDLARSAAADRGSARSPTRTATTVLTAAVVCADSNSSHILAMDTKLYALNRDVLGLIGALSCDAEQGSLLRVFRDASFHRVRWMAESCDRLVRAHSALWVTRGQWERRMHLSDFRTLQRIYARIPTLYIFWLRRLLRLQTKHPREYCAQDGWYWMKESWMEHGHAK